MSSTATLVYHATASGPVTPALLDATMGAIILDKVPIEEMTGALIISDNTTLTGATANRTIVFDISGVVFIERFPAGTEQSPFVDLYTHELGLGLNSKVIADPVVIT